MVLSLMAVASCNKDDDDDDVYTYSESEMTTLITAFGLQENDNVMDNLDSVFFTVDVDNGLIYNADSLPVGTNVTKLVATIDFMNTVSSAVFTIKGGTLQKDTTINYSTSSTDSIDFTGNVKLTVTSYDQSYVKVYDVKVNVHKMEPDSMMWNLDWRRDLPGATDNVITSKTVLQGSTYRCLVHNGDSYVLSSATEPNQETWEKQTVSFSFTPQVTSLTANDNYLYILDTDGELYSSEDGITWSDCNEQWYSIVGGYEDRVLGIWTDGSAYYHDEYPLRDGFAPTPVEDGFPITGSSQLVHADNSWVVTSQSMMVGGLNKNGYMVSDVWGYDGARWGQINDDHSDTLPELAGATLFPYYTYTNLSGTLRYKKHVTWFIVGGTLADGSLNKVVYTSNNQGINWTVADTACQMANHIPLFTGAQAYVNFETLYATTSSSAPRRVSSVVTSWPCPYIYLFGGYDRDGDALPFVWRGVYTRMTFYPLY